MAPAYHRFRLPARLTDLPIGRRLSLIVVTISMLTLVIVVYIALISTTLTLRQETTSTLLSRNRTIATTLDRRLQNIYLLLNDRVGRKLAASYTPDLTASEMQAAVSEITGVETNLPLQRIGIYIPDQPVVLLNFVSAGSGKDILNRQVDIARIPSDAWFIQAYETGNYGWYGLHPDVLEAPNTQIISLVLPLLDAAGDQVGVLTGDVSVSTLRAMVRDTILLEGELSTENLAYSLLLNQEGEILTDYNTGQRPSGLPDLAPLALSSRDLSDIDGAYPDGAQVFALNSPLTQAGWHLITVLPDSALPELPYQTVLQILLVSVVGLITLVVAINRFVWTTIARPAGILNAAAASIGSGKLREKVPFQVREKQDEIGMIARALEDMRLNLDMLYSTLEQRVEERTIQLETARQEAQATATELRAIYDESLSVVSDYQLQVILDNFVHRILTLLQADYCGVWLRRRSNMEELRLWAHTYPDQSLTNTVVHLGEGLAGTVALSGTPLIVEHYSQFPYRVHLNNAASIERALCVPLISSGQVIGAVMAGRPDAGENFTEEDQRMLTLFANLVAPTVRTAQLFQDLEIARADADRANQVKTRFLATVTHELRTPLNLIINNMDFMRVGAFGEVTDEQHSRLDQTIRSAEHLLYLINDLLDVSKIEAGEMQLYIQPADLYKVLDDAVDSAEMILDKDDKRAKVKFITSIPPGLPPVPMDARRVRQVLLNLLSNAIKFTLAGEVELKVQREGKILRIAVRDTGIGIPPDQYDRLFEAFERTDNARQLAIEGTGLGLPISKYLVEQHGGELGFKSEMGVGSTFWFTLSLTIGKLGMTQALREIETQFD